MRTKLFRQTVITLGRQDARAFRRSRRGRQLWERVEGGAKFASLFPDLVGRTLTITSDGIDFAGDSRMMLCVQWLIANGYL